MRLFQRYVPRLLPVAVIGILSACSVPSKAQDQPATPVVANTGDCAQGFVVVTPEAPGCGFTLTTAGKLTQDGKTVADPLVASYRQDASGNAAVAAGQVVLFPPSPSGRFRILQDPAMAKAWAITPEQLGKLKKIDFGGGPASIDPPAGDRAEIKKLWDEFQGASDKGPAQKKLVDKVDAMAHANVDASKKMLLDRINQITQVLTPEQVQKITK